MAPSATDTNASLEAKDPEKVSEVTDSSEAVHPGMEL